jgi:chromosome partitioning protein
MQVITVANQKGGAGKTTTAAALWWYLNDHGKPTLGIDLDAQGNFSYCTGADADQELNIYDVLEGEDINKAIQTVGGGDVIPSTYSLNSADVSLTGKGKATRLKKALTGLSKHYDYVVVDTEPHLGILSINALTASDRVIIPTQADVFSLQGIKQLWQNIRDVKKAGLNPSLSVDGLLLTRYNKRALLSQEVKEILEATAQKMETRLYKTAIRESISVKESQLSKASIFKATPKSNAAADYEAFVLEFLQNAK